MNLFAFNSMMFLFDLPHGHVILVYFEPKGI